MNLTKVVQSRKPKPASKIAAWKRFARLLATLLFVLAIPLGGYAIYVYGQIKEVEAQNLRTLAKAAGTTEALVTTLKKNVASLASDPTYACDFERRQTRLQLVSPKDCQKIGSFKKTADPRVDIRPEYVELILSVKMKLNREDAKDGDDDSQSDGECLNAGWASFSHSGDSCGASGIESEDTMEWSVRFDRLLADIPFGSKMDMLLIADHQGRVVRQHPDPLTLPEENSSVRLEDFSGRMLNNKGIRITDLRLFDPIDDNEETPDDEEVTRPFADQGTLLDDVVLTGVGYKIICQPLILGDLLIEGSTEPTNWVMCGLTHQGRAFREALQVAPFLTVFLLSLFFFGLFLWPIAKILTMSSRERFRFADVYLLLLGTWGALMLSSILIVSIDTYQSFEQAAKESLLNLASEIEYNLEHELLRMYQQLAAYDSELNEQLLGSGHQSESCDANKTKTLYLPEKLKNQTNLLEAELPAPLSSQFDPYPWFSSVFWVEPCSGMQIGKGTVRSNNTPLVSVVDRDYYKRVQSDALWAVPGGPIQNQPARFFVQPFRSKTTGGFFAGLSMRSKLSIPPDTDDFDKETEGRSTLESYWLETCNTNDAQCCKYYFRDLRKSYSPCGLTPVAAAVMSGQLLSATDPVLAPGVSFAITDSGGNVVFHSDERRALFENMFEELSDSQRFRAILNSGTESFLESSYRAQPHLLFTRPFENLPWSVVTLMDAEILRTSYLESLMHAVMLMLFHLFLYLLITLTYLLIRGRSSPVWMWPYFSRRASDYWWLTWMLLVLLPGTVLLVHALDLELLILVMLTPLLLILFFILGSMITHWHKDKNEIKNGRNVCIGTFLVTTFVGFGILAAVASFSGTSFMDTVGHWLSITMGLLWVGGLFAAILISSRKSNSRTEGSWQNSPVIPYMAVAVLMWIHFAWIPGYGYTRMAITDQIGVMAKLENLEVFHQLVRRQERTEQAAIDLGMPSEYLDDRLSLNQPDVYWSSVYWSLPYPVFDPALDQKVTRIQEPESKFASFVPLVSAFPWNRVAGQIPIYNDTSRKMRYLQQTTAETECRWRINKHNEIMFDHHDAGTGFQLKLRTRMSIEFPMFGIVTPVAAIFLLVLVLIWVRYGTRRILFGDIPPESCEQESGRTWTYLASQTPNRTKHWSADIRWWKRELDADDGLRTVISEKEDDLQKQYSTRRAALAFINVRAGEYYKSLWAGCCKDEQLVLVQLATEGVANPKQFDAVCGLMRRGLIRKDPVLRIMNQSFALFVCSAHDPEEIAKLERSVPGFDWQAAKRILLAAFILLFAFLLLTQPVAVESLLKYLSAAAAGVIAIVTLVNKIAGIRLGGAGD